MMRKLKEFLELIVAFARAAPYLFGFIFVSFTVAAGLSARIQSVTIHFDLPLLYVILFVSLSLYPIAKLAEWIINRNSLPPFDYAGLLWKPSLLGFGYPTPICPFPNCGCRVHYKVKQLSVIDASSDDPRSPKSAIYVQNYVDDHIYECPRHNRLSISNISISELKTKAKYLQSEL